MNLIHRLHLSILALTLAFAAPLLGQGSSANSFALMTITGDKQGQIKGEVTQRGRENQHRLLAYSHEIVSPRDPATGQATGKRQHQPFRIVKVLNQGSPPLMTAMTAGESLSSVVIDIWTALPTGIETKLLSYTLTNARIVSLRPWMPNRSDSSALTYPPAEEIAFTYQTIRVTYWNGGIESVDEWNGSAP